VQHCIRTPLLLSQVILTVRDPAKWYASVKETVWEISRVSERRLQRLAVDMCPLCTLSDWWHQCLPSDSTPNTWLVAGSSSSTQLKRCKHRSSHIPLSTFVEHREMFTSQGLKAEQISPEVWHPCVDWHAFKPTSTEQLPVLCIPSAGAQAWLY